jgi:hypothetical protein
MATSLLYSAPSTSYNSPWNVYLFKINDFAALSELVVGQEVTEITYLAAPPTEGGTGVGSILSFLYGSGGAPPFDLHLSPGGDSELTPDEKNKECFDKLVWDKQCIFAKDVLKYVNQVSFGYIKPEALECLKNEKRALEILNCYDTRDIEEETTNYNILTYKQIKKLLK